MNTGSSGNLLGLPRLGSCNNNDNANAQAPPSHGATVVVGMRARTGTDPGPPSRALLEAAKHAVGDSMPRGRRGLYVSAEGSSKRGYIQGRSFSSGERYDEYPGVGVGGTGGPAVHHASRSPSSGGGGGPVQGGVGDGMGVDRTRFGNSQGGSGAYDPSSSAFNAEDVNGFPCGPSGSSTPGGAVAGNGGGESCGRGSGSSGDRNNISSSGGGNNNNNHAHNNNTASAGSASTGTIPPGRTTGVRIRGGGIDITSLLSGEGDGGGEVKHSVPNRIEDTSNNAARHGSVGASASPRSSSAFHTVHGYHSQESNASSVGEYSYAAAGRAVTPSSQHYSGPADFRAEWPDGRPPLVRKRSLTVAMDADPNGGEGAGCPSPRGRRRSVEKPTDLPDATRLESPSCPPRPLTAPSRGVVGQGSGHGGCFSPPHYHRGRSAGANASPAGFGGARGTRDCGRLVSPSHERYLNQSAAGGTSSSGGGSALVATVNSNKNPSSVANTPATTAAATSSSTGGARSPMDVDWSNSTAIDGMPHTASPPVSAASPSPVPSATSSAPTGSGSILGRSPGPLAPSPGREHFRPGLSRAPQSPSPRRAPPSPAQAPGSAGLRRKGTRRLSGSRARSRMGHVRVRSSGSLGGGGMSRGDGSGGTFDGSDYDSDLSETSAYSAMGSLERQLQQDTFFELDEALWVVVTRREVCVYTVVILLEYYFLWLIGGGSGGIEHRATLSA